MSRSLLFVATLALPALIAGAALARDASTASAEVASEAEATAATAEADATEAQATADAALETANTADTTAGDATAEASFSNWRLQSMRAVKIATNAHRLSGIVSGDDKGAVSTVQVEFDGPTAGPAPLDTSYVGRWSFDDSAGQDSSGHLSIQASNNVTIDALEELDPASRWKRPRAQ